MARHGRRRNNSIPNLPDFKRPGDARAKIKSFIFRYNSKFPGVLWKLRNPSVRSSRYGRVIEKGYLRGYGQYIIIDHGKGWLSFYSNLAKVFVKKGSQVETGARIGTAKNKKLFFSISYRGKPLNPTSILNRSKHDFEPA